MSNLPRYPLSVVRHLPVTELRAYLTAWKQPFPEPCNKSHLANAVRTHIEALESATDVRTLAVKPSTDEKAEEARFMCSECSKSYKFKKAYDKHMATHSQKQEQRNSNSSNTTSSSSNSALSINVGGANIVLSMQNSNAVSAGTVSNSTSSSGGPKKAKKSKAKKKSKESKAKKKKKKEKKKSSAKKKEKSSSKKVSAAKAEKLLKKAIAKPKMTTKAKPKSNADTPQSKGAKMRGGWTVKQFQDELKRRGLKISGTKIELAERLGLHQWPSVESLKVAELKEQLQANDKPVTGNKIDLRIRLFEVLAANGEAPAHDVVMTPQE